MIKKIVYLHIEKSAGTSFRGFLQKNIGDQEKICWWNKETKNIRLNSSQVNNSIIIGGHRKFASYKGMNALYLAVLREPSERVLSLFNYYVNQNIMNAKGFDSNSISNTIKNCKSFRNNIKSAQCSYLSGSEYADMTKEHIKTVPFIIGTFEKLDVFLQDSLAKLSLNFHEFPEKNVGKKGYMDSLILDSEAQVILDEILQEDYKLYTYLRDECDGLYDNSQEFAIDWQFINYHFHNEFLDLKNSSKNENIYKQGLDPFIEKRVYTYEDLSKYHDDEFIENLYYVVLNREPDSVGLKHYLHSLREGTKTKSELISLIRYSKEGKEVNVEILGSKKRYLLAIIYKVPIIKYFTKILVTLVSFAKLKYLKKIK